jgi:hypothetical protein
MNPLERYGIDHLSPSSLNLWRASPGLWSARYLAGLKDDNAAMWRGHAVEAGLVRMFRGGSIGEARSAALDLFEENATGESSEHVQIQRNLIIPMLDTAAAWEAPAKLAATQLRVEHRFSGVPVPIIGFVDFALTDGIDVELKTTKARPSKPRADHVRQVALYRAARKRRGGILYVTDKRAAFYEIEDDDVRPALADLASAARSLAYFLDRIRSARDALSCLPIDWDDWRASAPLRAAVENLLTTA